MRRYKLAVHILFILSVFNFVLVLTVPVPVQEVREAWADVVDGGQDVIIVSAKRADEGQDPALTHASPGQLLTSSPDPPGSPSTSDSASGVHQETTNPIQPPSSASGEIRRPPYASGGAELPWYSSGDTKPHRKTPGGVQRVQPGTTSKFLPSNSMRTKTYSFAPGHWEAKRPSTEIGPATPTPSESSDEIAPASSSKVLQQWEQEGYL